MSAPELTVVPRKIEGPSAAPVESGRRPRVFVVLPAYNEEANIGSLLDRLDESMENSFLLYETIVVDDGSRDGTLEILNRSAQKLPLTIVRHQENQGLGATIRDGILFAAQMGRDNDIVVTMDADESHTPGLILRMVRMVQEGHDVVIASRYQPGARTFGVPLSRRFLSYGASCLFRLLFPTRGVRDFTCGYRAYRVGIVKEALATYGPRFITTAGFQSMVDILLKLRRMPVIFGEVPLILRYDLKDGASKMRVTRTAVQTLQLILRRRLGCYN